MIVSNSGRRLGDRVDGDQALGVLDLCLDADPADLEPHRLLDLGEQRVERDDLLGVLHLRQHDAVQVRPGALDHLDDVAVGPVRRPVVDPDDPDLVAPPALVERRDDVLARAGLGQWRAGVLEIEEHLVGGQTLRLLEEARVAAGDGETRTAGTEGLGHDWQHADSSRAKPTAVGGLTQRAGRCGPSLEGCAPASPARCSPAARRAGTRPAPRPTSRRADTVLSCCSRRNTGTRSAGQRSVGVIHCCRDHRASPVRSVLTTNLQS